MNPSTACLFMLFALAAPNAWADETTADDTSDTSDESTEVGEYDTVAPLQWYEKLPVIRFRPLDDDRRPFDGLRLRAGLGYNQLGYSQSSETTDNTNFPAMGEFSTPLIPFWMNVESMVYKDMIGVDAGFSIAGYNTEIAGSTFNEWERNVNIGIRYRHVYKEKWIIEVIGGYRTGSDIVFKYSDDERTTANTINVNMGGAELGAALVYRKDKLSARASLTETFSPFPIGTRLHAMADYEYMQLPAMEAVLVLHADLGLDLNHFNLAQSDETIFVLNSNLVANVGAGILW